MWARWLNFFFCLVVSDRVLFAFLAHCTLVGWGDPHAHYTILHTVVLTLTGRPTAGSGMESLAPSARSRSTAGDAASIRATRRSRASFTVSQSLNETISSPENSFTAGEERSTVCCRQLDATLPSVTGNCACFRVFMSP